MNPVVLTDLPPEIITNILSRLPLRTIISFKIVCKSWLEIIKAPEFAKIHLSRSVPGLLVNQSEISSEYLKLFEFEDVLEILHHELHYKPVTMVNHREFINPLHTSICMQGSADGLLFLREINTRPQPLYLCNPITREYIELPVPDGRVHFYPSIVTYGFGVSKMTSQYKVVRIFHECIRDPGTNSLLGIPRSECQVYTLGTGSWRSIVPGATLEYNCRSVGTFLEGSLHWLVADLSNLISISCLDLETEKFSILSPPPFLPVRRSLLGGIVALEDHLCLCDNTSDYEIVVWMMKEYGMEKSWNKEFVISKLPDLAGPSYKVVYPMKIFEDGDILLLWGDFYLFYYSQKTKTTTSRIDVFQLHSPGCIEAMLHTSSFISLKRLVMENVKSF